MRSGGAGCPLPDTGRFSAPGRGMAHRGRCECRVPAMNRPVRASLTTILSLLAAALACAAMLSPAAASAETTTTTVHYVKETQQDYERQLAAREIKEAVFNKRIRSLHLILKNGQHVLFIYPPKHEPQLSAQLKQHGITVTVLTPTEAKKEAGKPAVHHKLRYIAGGILVVVVIVVVAVLLVDRKRKEHAE